ncbi:MAG: 30S ribosomal protein S3 [Planctomycetes bacterium]|nr:30S ribosomal protein S3 [Planctomycetota bacterium]
MGQKIHPLGFRIGVRERWRSRWNASKKDFPGLLKEDQELRKYVKHNYFYAGIPKIEIERTTDAVTLIIHTARPGILIGRKGKKLEEIQVDLQKIVTDKDKTIRVQIAEINRPELDGQLVAESVREQLEKRQAFRRVIKKTLQTTINAGAKGIKVMLAGRLGGSEMSRREHKSEGTIPLSTLDADVSYGFTEAKMSTGHIGVKCWIYRGKYGESRRMGGGTGEMRPRRTRQTRFDGS